MLFRFTLGCYLKGEWLLLFFETVANAKHYGARHRAWCHGSAGWLASNGCATRNQICIPHNKGINGRPKAGAFKLRSDLTNSVAPLSAGYARAVMGNGVL